MASDWRRWAACTPATAHLFEVVLCHGPIQFLSADNVRATTICAGCPVRRKCLDDALGRPFDAPVIAGGQLVWDGRVVEASTLRAEIEELSRAGLTDRQIAARTGVHIRTAQRHLHAARLAALERAA